MAVYSGVSKRFLRLGSAPGAANEGDCYWDNGTHGLFVYNGSSWTSVVVGGGSSPFLAPNGSAGAPSYSFTNFPTFGLYAATGTLGEAMGTGQLLIVGTTDVPTALTATIVAGAGVDAGTHSYKVTFVTAGGETSAGAVSNTVTTAAGNLQVNLTGIPLGNAFVTSRKIYRTAAGNAATGPWLLQSNIANNTATTLSDNTADAALTTTIPTTNTAIDTRWTFANSGNITQAQGQLLLPNGTAAAPSYSFAGLTDTGIYNPGGGHRLGLASQGALVAAADATNGRNAFWVLTGLDFGGSPGAGDLFILRDAANVLAQRNGVNAQTFNWYNTTDGTNKEYVTQAWSGNVAYILTTAAGTGSGRTLTVGGGAGGAFAIRTGNTDRWTMSSTAGIFQGQTATEGRLTAGTMTATNQAEIRTVTHRYDWTNAMVVALGAPSAGDITVCTLPAKTKVLDVMVVIDSPDTSVNALTVACGTVAAGYIDYVVASDAKAAANTVYGDATGERGTNMVIAGGHLASYTGTTAVNCHFIKTTSALSTVLGSTGHVLITTQLLP